MNRMDRGRNVFPSFSVASRFVESSTQFSAEHCKVLLLSLDAVCLSSVKRAYYDKAIANRSRGFHCKVARGLN